MQSSQEVLTATGTRRQTKKRAQREASAKRRMRCLVDNARLHHRAGIAWLVTAKVLKEDGFEIVVFEKHAEVGGVWASSRTYPGLRANNSRESYAFSDFTYPDTADDFPTADQIRAYLNVYAEPFGLRPLIRLSTEVRCVKRLVTVPPV